ncbi:MAG: anaerobic sulfite reductase subunit AsrB [Nanoarchaeota archaeon]
MEKENNEYIPEMYNISQLFNQTHDTKLFRVKSNMNPMPGQFVELSILGVGECPISVCSYNPDCVDLTIRRVGNVTGKLFELGKNAKVGLRGPYGNGYPMEDFEGKNLILVGGGTGFAPLRGVIKYLEQHKDKYQSIKIFAGFRTPEDILFKKEIEKWKKKFSFTLTIDKKTKGWRGKVGVITQPLEKASINPENTEVLICGPPVMIKFVKQTLFQKGFKKNQIWLSLERDMQCGIGKCGHCMINNMFVCKDGPVFNLTKIEDVKGE